MEGLIPFGIHSQYIEWSVSRVLEPCTCVVRKDLRNQPFVVYVNLLFLLIRSIELKFVDCLNRRFKLHLCSSEWQLQISLKWGKRELVPSGSFGFIEDLRLPYTSPTSNFWGAI